MTWTPEVSDIEPLPSDEWILIHLSRSPWVFLSYEIHALVFGIRRILTPESSDEKLRAPGEKRTHEVESGCSIQYRRLYSEQSRNLIVTIVYFKYFQVHNTLSFRKSPVLQSVFSRHISLAFCVILFYTFLWVLRLLCLDPLLCLIFELVHERFGISDSASSLVGSDFERKKMQRLLLPWRLLWKRWGLRTKRRSATL